MPRRTDLKPEDPGLKFRFYLCASLQWGAEQVTSDLDPHFLPLAMKAMVNPYFRGPFGESCEFRRGRCLSQGRRERLAAV